MNTYEIYFINEDGDYITTKVDAINETRAMEQVDGFVLSCELIEPEDPEIVLIRIATKALRKYGIYIKVTWQDVLSASDNGKSGVVEVLSDNIYFYHVVVNNGIASVSRRMHDVERTLGGRIRLFDRIIENF